MHISEPFCLLAVRGYFRYFHYFSRQQVRLFLPLFPLTTILTMDPMQKHS